MLEAKVAKVKSFFYHPQPLSKPLSYAGPWGINDIMLR